MSLYSRPSSGGTGGIDPAALAALVDDNEAAALAAGLLSAADATNMYGGIVNTVHSRADMLSTAVDNARVAILDNLPSAGLPVGFVAEFPANSVPANFSVLQGLPDSLPSGIGTAAISRTTGSATSHRGFAVTLGTSRIWSLYGTTLAALDFTVNKYDAITYGLPASPGTGAKSAVLHDMSDSKALVTIGNNGTLGDNRAYTFDAVAKTFTQVANFQMTGTDGQARAGQGGTTLRLADGRIFWLPSETWRTTSTQTAHSNLGATNGGFYFLYTPSSNTVTTNRFSNWATALATGDIGETGSGGAQSGLHASLPIAQLPDGRLVLQELGASTSRYFFLDLDANTITQGSGTWTGGQWAMAAHPQGLVTFQAGSTARRYFNASTNAMDAANATTYSTASVSATNFGYGYKALPLGNGNYALPGNNGSSDVMALAFDGFVRLGTVKARKTA